jgi:chromosome segregation ATPase
MSTDADYWHGRAIMAEQDVTTLRAERDHLREQVKGLEPLLVELRTAVEAAAERIKAQALADQNDIAVALKEATDARLAHSAALTGLFDLRAALESERRQANLWRGLMESLARLPDLASANPSRTTADRCVRACREAFSHYER